MKSTNIFHVEFKTIPEQTDKIHHYFGSAAAMFEVFTWQQLGVSQNRLYTNLSACSTYTNKVCTIRKGKMYRKSGNRKRPINNI